MDRRWGRLVDIYSGGYEAVKEAMYGLGIMPRERDIPKRLPPRARERWEARGKHVEEVKELNEKAQAKYPNLPAAEAKKKYLEYEAGKETARQIQREYWPVIAAAGAGLLLFTFLKK